MASRLKAQTQVRKGLIIRIRFKTSLLQSSLHTNGAFLALSSSLQRTIGAAAVDLRLNEYSLQEPPGDVSLVLRETA
jgi:hypothetical protein